MTYQTTVLSLDEVQAEMRLFEAHHCGKNPHTKQLNSTTGEYVYPSVHDAFIGWLSKAEYIKQQAEKQYTLYWLDGKRQVVKGPTIAAAVTSAGYGQGAMAAMDFYEHGDNHEYEYLNKRWERKTWERKTPIIQQEN